MDSQWYSWNSYKYPQGVHPDDIDPSFRTGYGYGSGYLQKIGEDGEYWILAG